jgi:hypothetical protein
MNISFLIILFPIFRQKFHPRECATNNTPNEGGKFHRGEVKEVETFQYLAKDERVFTKKHRPHEVLNH